MTEHDYRRLTGRCYELHEKRRPGQPTDAADGDRTDSRDAEKDGDSQDADDDTDASADDDGEQTPASGQAPGSAPPDDEEPEAGEEPVDGVPAAAAPAGPKPDDDDGNEKPLPPNKDGIWKGKGPWRKPTTVMGASREVPKSWIHRQVRG